ncbi:MAG: N-acetyl-gamma-glutamyl-phosphate reductase [Actinobacteria bacterium]|nr:MAG: N-acetyl-gamma-glutamyl-phosphate reductase [Actinomycetota bacterium]
MKAGIIGASGYTGAELLRILDGHPEVETAYVTAHTYAGKMVVDLYPHLHRYAETLFSTFDAREAIASAGIHFVALPHGESMQVVPQLLEGGAKVIDLSADYRLSHAGEYKQWYDLEHTSPHLLEDAVYGLPEMNGERIVDARLVAVPGCYPTAALLALAPPAKAGLVGIEGVVVDAKSGISGAGRSLSLAAHFAQADESVKPYNVGAHRHTPEMEEVLSSLAGEKTQVVFTPHLVPMSRGILATCYMRVGTEVDDAEIERIYGEYYAGCPFVILLGSGVFPETKAVSGSNYCHIGWNLDSQRRMLTVAAAIDNLVKGASGQAVQCMNLMQGWSEDAGLEAMGIFP